jgi:hypothetical protein
MDWITREIPYLFFRCNLHAIGDEYFETEDAATGILNKKYDSHKKRGESFVIPQI